MHHLRRAQILARPSIAVALAYVLALQLLLSGFAGMPPRTSLDGSVDGAFVICLGSNGAIGDHDGGAPSSDGQSHCIFCILAKVPQAVLPADCALVMPVVAGTLERVTAIDDQVAGFTSPTNTFQRGPPSALILVG